MDDTRYDGDPGGLVCHEAIEEDDKDSGVCPGDVGAGNSGAGFMWEDNVCCGDLFWDSHGLDR